jgi:hypothetical protein
MGEYFEKIDQECKKKYKTKKDDLQIVEKKVIKNDDGQEMCFIVTKFRATQGLFKNISKMTMLQIYNAAYYCQESKRIIIISLISTPERMEKDNDLFMDVILSVKTKKVEEFEVEEENQTVSQNTKEQKKKLHKRLFSKDEIAG